MKGDDQCSFLPAVEKHPQSIREPDGSTNICHGMSQVIPMYVHVDEHAYKCSASTGNHCYHVDSVESRHFLHLERNSCKP
jgi:hypothetical protein